MSPALSRGGGDPDLHPPPVVQESRSQTRDNLEQCNARLYGPLRRVVRAGSTQTECQSLVVETTVGARGGYPLDRSRRQSGTPKRVSQVCSRGNQETSEVDEHTPA